MRLGAFFSPTPDQKSNPQQLANVREACESLTTPTPSPSLGCAAFPARVSRPRGREGEGDPLGAASVVGRPLGCPGVWVQCPTRIVGA